DTCQGGTCTGGNPVICQASDQCHDAGTCDPSTGICTNLAKSNGTTCDDGNKCTTGDTCQSGTCTGTAVVCTASDRCLNAGTCDPSIGQCSNPIAPDGTACGNGTPQGDCDQPDKCVNGVCNANWKPAGAVCRPAVGDCDVAETCTGTSTTCPADSFKT